MISIYCNEKGRDSIGYQYDRRNGPNFKCSFLPHLLFRLPILPLDQI